LQSCLTTRQASHIQAIPLSFGLKRILVEDWENLNNSNNNNNDDGADAAADEPVNRDMVHVLPAKVTIRDALRLYLEEKGVTWDGRTKQQLSGTNKTNEKSANCNNRKQVCTETEASPGPGPGTSLAAKCEPTTESSNDSGVAKDSSRAPSVTPTSVPSSLPHETMQVKRESDAAVAAKDDSSSSETSSRENNGRSDNGKGVSIQLVKEWTDMANGIVLYFEQALISRLLYPSEISQLLVLEDNIIHETPDGGNNNNNNNNTPLPLKVDIYGCEHLLRLIAAIPRILDQQLQDSRKKRLRRKQNAVASKDPKKAAGEQRSRAAASAEAGEDDADRDNDAFVEIGAMIIAKLQDLSRFLQKKQSSLFGSMYRKKNEQEIKRDAKIQRRTERRLKTAAAAAAAVEESLNNIQNSETDGVVD